MLDVYINPSLRFFINIPSDRLIKINHEGIQMNIFEALSQGKGRLNEENLSAMLGFLLSPYKPHGLSDIFLRRFLKVVAKKCGNENHFDNVLKKAPPLKADVLLEEPYQLKSKKRVVDIDIRIYSSLSTRSQTDTKKVEVHRVVIENKIKAGSAGSGQFKDEFQGILGDIGDENDSITALIKEILKSESEAEILPLSEYLRHTLKAFVRHIEEGSAGTPVIVADGFTISNVATIETASGEYRIEQYANSTIRVVNLNTNKYEAAMSVLTKINKEKSLGISLNLPNGKPKNARDLGTEVLKELIGEGKKE